MLPKIKICCISSTEEAQIAIQAGASALGLVSEMPSGPGVISNIQIREIAQTVPPPIATFLLTSRQNAKDIIAQHNVCRTNTLQLVDHVPHTELEKLRDHLPGIGLVQVIHVLDQTSVTEAQAVSPYVDALLLDSGNPNLSIKELGGTGRTHNWQLSQEICETCPIPIFLAGGLTAQNVNTAIQTVRPFGLDLCSSLRTHNKLDPHKVTQFFKAIQSPENA